MKNKKIFIVIGGKWFDKKNGNTYHNSKIIDIETNRTYYSGYAYGYGRCYITSAEEYIIKELHIQDYKLIDCGNYYMNKADLKWGQF